MTSFPLVPLRFLSALPITNGLGEAAADGDESWPRYIRTTDISGLDRLDPAKRVTLPPHVAAAAPVLRDDILMTAAGSLGTAYHHASDEPACYAGYLVRWRIDPEKASPRFMAYWTQSKHHLDQIAVGAVRSTIDNFSASKFRAMQAPAPPLDQQRAIADFLDQETTQIDAMVDAQERLVTLLEERRAAAATRAATLGLDNAGSTRPSGEPWFDRVPEHWSVIPGFAALELIQTGPFGSQVHAEDYVEDGTPLINPAHMVAGVLVPDPKVAVSEEKAEDLSRHLLQPGDVIAARRGELGRCAVVRDSDPRALCGTGSLLMRVRSDQFDARYFAEIFSSEPSRTALLQNSVGSTMDNLNAAMVSRMRFPCPPLPEQRAIVDYIRSTTARTDAMIAKARESIALMKERRAAVISAAVTGRIDVRTGNEQGERDLEEARA